MLLSLWNYLRGYVMIEVSGFSVERLINMAVHKGVYIWDVENSPELEQPKKKIKKKQKRRYNRRGEFIIVKKDVPEPTGTAISPSPGLGVGSVRMKTSVKGFKRLRECAKKTKSKIKIKKKFGLPFLLFKYRKRKFLALGVLFFVFSLYFLSSFIWLVQINGTQRIDYEQFVNYLKEKGVHAGALKYNIDRKELEKDLMKQFPDISWVNIDITGTKASITLTEIKPKLQILDISTPCDIVAKKDGLIMTIATSAGTPKVKPGDVVRAGDILVSSELLVGNEETGITKKYVHAISEIRAKMYYEFSFDVPLVYDEQIPTGNIKKEFAAILLGKTVRLSRVDIPYFDYDIVIDRKQLQFGENYPLPFMFMITEYREFEKQERERTVEQAQAIAQEIVTSRILREFDFDADIIDKKIEYTKQGNILKASAYVTTVERIDEEKEINLSPILNPIPISLDILE